MLGALNLHIGFSRRSSQMSNIGNHIYPNQPNIKLSPAGSFPSSTIDGSTPLNPLGRYLPPFSTSQRQVEPRNGVGTRFSSLDRNGSVITDRNDLSSSPSDDNIRLNNTR